MHEEREFIEFMRERVFDKLTLLRGSFASLLYKVCHGLVSGVNVEETILYLGQSFAKIYYIVSYAVEHGKFWEAEEFLAGVDLAVDEFLTCDETVFATCLASFHKKIEELATEIFGGFPELSFSFVDL
ncbi:MAG: hypothetical protein GU346_06305 [Thermocrinis sp.]|jgi:hypothetical protein|nr:hypothetical protein [Thermocrinis sp.]